MVEKYDSLGSIFDDQRTKMLMTAMIFKIKYNFTDSTYIISGVQSKESENIYKPEHSSSRMTYAIEYVIGAQENMVKVASKKPIAFTTGMKHIKEEFSSGT